MSCIDKKYIVKEIIVQGGTGFIGPQGPPGPPGPPGPIPDSYPADQVTVSGHSPYVTVQDVIDALLYVPVDILTFTGGTNQFELGRQLTAITFNWTINKDIVSQTLVGPAEMTPIVLTASQRSVTVSLANLSSNATFTLQVNDGNQVDSQNWSVSFVNRNYYGDANIPGAINEAFVKSLTSLLKSNRSHTYTTNAIGTQYNWYCFPHRYGTPTFYAGGFEGGYQFIQTISLTNNFGYTEDYDIYRSDFPGIGPGVTIQVS